MGLLQKREVAGLAQPLYSLSSEQSLLIVGLGNPGREYEDTRHNIGFEAVSYFAEKNDFSGWTEKKDLKCQLATATLGQTKVILVKPTTFMNLSGEAVQAVQHFYRIYNDRMVVIHDELDIPFGEIRTKVGGGTAGHNGLKSLVQHLGEDFGRIRIGVRNEIAEKADAADFVLGKFTKDEQASVALLIKEVNAILGEYIFGGQKLTAETRAVL